MLARPDLRLLMERRRALRAVALAALLAACGRKGDLELPAGSGSEAPAATEDQSDDSDDGFDE
ncbi:MAG TPA: lipoprotein [Geminicoccaceae bacterium]|nr:lipoprotein [Geminicoccaceae bacterium]